MVDASLLRKRDVFVPNTESVDDYVARVEARFKAHRVRPTLRAVAVPDHVAAFVGGPAGARLVYFVTDDDPQSVFYDESTRSFGSAWDPEKESGAYMDIGQRSPDPLAMVFA